MKPFDFGENKRIWLPAAGTFLVMCCLSIRFASGPDRDIGDGVTSDKAPASRAPAPRPRASGLQGAPQGVQHAGPRSDRPTPKQRLHPVIESALHDDPALAHYHWLSSKVLPTDEHRKMLHEMLSDPEQIQKVKMDLLASTESAFSKESEGKRMLCVEFLTDAIAWSENPEIDLVREAIEDVLFAQNISEAMPEDLARSLAGDKVELFTQVLHASPEQASILADRARGKEVEPLLVYAKNTYVREINAMRADELGP